MLLVYLEIELNQVMCGINVALHLLFFPGTAFLSKGAKYVLQFGFFCYFLKKIIIGLPRYYIRGAELYLFKGLHLLPLPNVSGATFISPPTSYSGLTKNICKPYYIIHSRFTLLTLKVMKKYRMEICSMDKIISP